ncbi:DMT family transporter [Spirulina subsalsa FACHB-351]|uniref:DMT family transporter n=2 Tax=Spirulina subsalsa TaxID=54311 RepID=A0ABT3L8P7_9CYAN|nr:DMT family transporter [Spirulina subsalsa FACHB-351]
MELGLLGGEWQLGALAALGAALFWALATVIYGQVGQTFAPLWLNLFKGGIAIALLTLTLLLTADPIPSQVLAPVGLLLISGVVGIGLGDTAFLFALSKLGARRTLLLETLAPPLTACLAWLFLGETLPLRAWLGIVLVLLGVGWVIAERTPDWVRDPAHLKQGLLWGVLSTLCQGVGAVLSRAALVQSTLTPLWSTLLRLLGGMGMIILLLALLKTGQRRPTGQILRSPKLWGAIALAALLGTYLGIWLQQTAFKLAPAGIAQTFLATSPLFVLPLAALLKEPISLRAVLGVFIALLGISLLFSGGTA